MKVSFDIDCTPEEARRMLGLPDVTPVNEAVVEELTKRAAEMAQNMDADKMMQQWMTAGVQGFGDMQKAFMEQFAKAQRNTGGNTGGSAGGGGSETKD